MNDNYLLHSETAKRLYFEYAKDLPIISLCSQKEPSDKLYNNITEAFLINDFYKLDAMRHCGVHEKYITGDSSDYEKFKAFCSALPRFAGHPIYLLSHIELKKHFNSTFEINEENCDLIWNETNAYIISSNISEKSLLENCGIEHHYAVSLSWMQELYSNNELNDFSSLESFLLEYIREANANGCRIAQYNAFSNFVKPNPYLANEIVKRMKSKDMSYELEDCELVDMQIARTLGIEYKKLGWTWLLTGSGIDEDALEYLEESRALPRTALHIQFEVGESEDYLELQLRGYAIKHPLGKVICTVNTADNSICYARNDYFRRVLCNVIAKLVDDGEYTNDENTLKKLIEDILYNNLKEAIT